MPRRLLVLLCLGFSLLLGPVLSAVAQQEMEIIPLRSRTVSEVLPGLLPLVEPGGTLTGMNDRSALTTLSKPALVMTAVFFGLPSGKEASQKIKSYGAVLGYSPRT